MKSKNNQTSVLKKIDKFTETVEDVIMSIGLYAISIIVFANVVFRYFFGGSFIWAEELSRYILIWITFLGISSCARYESHVTVDILPSLLKGPLKRVNEIIVTTICLATSIYMTYVSIVFTNKQFAAGNVSIAVAFPSWLIFLSATIGFILLDYIYIKKFIRFFTSGNGESEGTEKC